MDHEVVGNGLCFWNSLFFFFFFFFSLIFERKKDRAWVGEGHRERHRFQSRLQALSYQHRAQCRAQTQNCQVMTWAEVQCLINQLSHWVPHRHPRNSFESSDTKCIMPCIGIRCYENPWNLEYVYPDSQEFYHECKWSANTLQVSMKSCLSMHSFVVL